MTDEVSQRLDKAARLLAQIGGLDPATHGEMLVHHAYHAMFHAASAVVLARTGTVPVRHATVVSEFGRLMRDIGGEGRRHGRALNRARMSVWLRTMRSTPGSCRPPQGRRPRRPPPWSASAANYWRAADLAWRFGAACPGWQNGVSRPYRDNQPDRLSNPPQPTRQATRRCIFPATKPPLVFFFQKTVAIRENPD